MTTEAITERLAVLENQRRTLQAFGWGETPALDAEIAAVAALLPRADGGR